jgi:hypothetical protein
LITLPPDLVGKVVAGDEIGVRDNQREGTALIRRGPSDVLVEILGSGPLSPGRAVGGRGNRVETTA